jgi:nucleolar complex protein 3
VNDVIIRKLTILSQLAVFKDVIPGYRIRPLTDAEKSEKVSQHVARTREWEQGLVVVYQSYLRDLESEVKGLYFFILHRTGLIIHLKNVAKSDLADVALRCICKLAAEVTHFNFSVNLMGTMVAHLSRRSWDKVALFLFDYKSGPNGLNPHSHQKCVLTPSFAFSVRTLRANPHWK